MERKKDLSTDFMSRSNRKESRMKAQRNPSRRPNDKTVLRAVINKVAAQGLVRHVNGNTLDNHVENMQRVTVLQAFQHKTWIIDAECLLNEAEFAMWSKARQDWAGDMSLFQ
jgi:hypothetical protein